MRKWAFLFGLMAVFAALVIAAGQAFIADEPLRATATWSLSTWSLSTWAGGVFSIPLAAAIRL